VYVRILHALNQVSGRAGAEVSVRDIITHTAGELEHAVVVLRSSTNVLAPFEAVGVACYVPDRDLRTRTGHVGHVRDAIVDFRPDLVHTSLFDADLAGRIAAWLEGVPVVSSLVNTPYAREAIEVEPVGPTKRRLVRLADRILARHLTSGFHAISDAAAAHAVEHLGVDPASIRVVPRGRSRAVLGERSPERRASVRTSLGWGTTPVVVNVARQEPQKGQSVLLDAWPSVLDAFPDATLVLVGRRGRSSHELDAQIDRLALSGSVVQFGVRTDVTDLLAAADVFAFPSLFEGLGGAAVEALGLGLPIVASDIPALRELIGDDGGWLVPVGDPVGFAEALREALRGGTDVETRGAVARRRFDRSYELDRCLQGMVGFYRVIEEQLTTPVPGGRRRRPQRLELARDIAAGGR
jgi:glycosyltransferase involved in cell wall biosynthesis